MEQHTLKNVNKCLNTNIYSYLETSVGQSPNLFLNKVNVFNTNVNYMSLIAKNHAEWFVVQWVCLYTTNKVNGCEFAPRIHY